MNRTSYILELVRDKKVLDVGGIGHSIERSKKNNWLHKKVARCASYTLGIDLDKDEVKKAQELGYNFIFGNAERLSDYTNQKFDICLAGELIEHLSNPGLFLESAHTILNDTGILIITTPNAFSVGNIFRILKYIFKRKIKTSNSEHKAWYCLITLEQLLNAHGFKVIKIFTTRPEREDSSMSFIKNFLYGNANSKILCLARKY
jgi:2-polyprenyl-3-methyl-5-hydroxy-6-metoxy-1,4-benzoquinol methylase